jgi:uncharacterized protein (DUF488 family)
MNETDASVLTIGHSTLPYEQFAALLRGSGATAIADVRSAPYSRYSPQFNRETLRDALRADGLSYVFMGDDLGGRPAGRDCFSHGVADYEKMAQRPNFQSGLERVTKGAKLHRVALMCSEQDPLDCHRCLLLGRALAARRVGVAHILPTGKQTTQAEIEQTLLVASGRDADDLFASREERLATAYRERARKVAFAEASATAAE